MARTKRAQKTSAAANNKNGIAVATHSRHRKSLTLEHSASELRAENNQRLFLANINIFRSLLSENQHRDDDVCMCSKLFIIRVKTSFALYSHLMMMKWRKSLRNVSAREKKINDNVTRSRSLRRQ
jgi:hypothetical protein